MTPLATAQSLWNAGDYQKVAVEHMIVSERLCEHVNMGAGKRVLDVGCGTGNTAIAAAHRRARVTGVDVAETLLQRARLRAHAEQLDDIEFLHGDAAALPFADDNFDFVLSTFGAVFLLDQQLAADELLRVLRPGGVLGLTCYTQSSIPARIYELGARLLPASRSARPAHAWADGERVRELLGSRVGAVRITTHRYTACFSSAEEYVAHQARYYAPLRARFERLSVDDAAAYWQGIVDILRDFNRATDGSLMATFDYAQITAIKHPYNAEYGDDE